MGEVIHGAGVGPDDLGSEDDGGDTFPGLTVQPNVKSTVGGITGSGMDNTRSESGVFAHNTPYVWPSLCH